MGRRFKSLCNGFGLFRENAMPRRHISASAALTSFLARLPVPCGWHGDGVIADESDQLVEGRIGVQSLAKGGFSRGIVPIFEQYRKWVWLGAYSSQVWPSCYGCFAASENQCLRG